MYYKVLTGWTMTYSVLIPQGQALDLAHIQGSIHLFIHKMLIIVLFISTINQNNIQTTYKISVQQLEKWLNKIWKPRLLKKFMQPLKLFYTLCNNKKNVYNI